MIYEHQSIVDRLLDAQSGVCAYCGIALADRAHIDHIHPRVKGGTDDLANLQILCPHCNTSKGGKTEAEYFAQFSESLPWNHMAARIRRMAYWHTEFGQDNEHELRFVE